MTELSDAEVTAICDAADKAWAKAKPNARSVRFKWRGETYVSTMSSFRMKVDTVAGKPVASRYA